MDDKQQPIIVKKVKKGGHGHHGGAWKVAYADFVTAMMAFFLLMWLLGGSSQHVREGIADWFKNPTGVQGPGGASTSLIKLGGAMEVPRSKKLRKAPSDENKVSYNAKEGTGDHTSVCPEPSDKQGDGSDTEKIKIVNVSKEEIEADRKRLEVLEIELSKAIDNSQALAPYKDQILLDITPEGLRIQIVDSKNRPMFDSSSAILKPYTKNILREIGKIINTVPNHIAISGHTDAAPFRTKYIYVEYGSFEERRAYSNWELSADRANAARRELVKGGMKSDKIARVVGLSSSVLFNKAKPNDPVNRRISIIVLNKETEAAAGLLEGPGGAKPPEIPDRLNGQ